MKRPSPAMIVASVALFISLGGTGWAVMKLPKNSVGTAQIKSKAVTKPKIAPNAVDSAIVKNGSLTGADLRSDVQAKLWYNNWTGFIQLTSTNLDIVSISSLPAGKYLVEAKANVFNNAIAGQTSRITCGLYTTIFSGGILFQVTIATDKFDLNPRGPADTYNYGKVMVVGPISLPAPRPVTLKCHNEPGNGITELTEAVVTATRVAAITKN